MKFTVQDRMVISALYPRQSDILNQLIVKDIESKVRLTKSELKDIDFSSAPDGRGFVWNTDKGKEMEIDVEFTKAELAFLKSRIQELDKKKAITQNILDLIIKIRDVKI